MPLYKMTTNSTLSPLKNRAHMQPKLLLRQRRANEKEKRMSWSDYEVSFFVFNFVGTLVELSLNFSTEHELFQSGERKPASNDNSEWET